MFRHRPRSLGLCFTMVASNLSTELHIELVPKNILQFITNKWFFLSIVMLGLRLFQCIIKVEAGFEPSRSRWSQLFHNHQPLRHSFLTSLFLIIQKKFGERLHRKAFSWCNYKWRLHSFFLSLCLVLNLSLFHTLSLTYTHSLSRTFSLTLSTFLV